MTDMLRPVQDGLMWSPDQMNEACVKWPQTELILMLGLKLILKLAVDLKVGLKVDLKVGS